MRPVLAPLATILLLVTTHVASASTPLALDDLSDDHRKHVTCTMLAGVAADEFERGLRKDTYGLGQDDLERLGEGLAELLAGAYSADAETTRALLKAEYEVRSAEAMKLAADDVDGPASLFDDLAENCRPQWAAGAVLPPPSYHDKPVDAYFCYALESAFAQALAPQPEIAKVFAGRADRIEEALLEEEGQDQAARQDVRDGLANLAASFDIPTWDALPEVEAEAIMTWCDTLAGPDE